MCSEAKCVHLLFGIGMGSFFLHLSAVTTGTFLQSGANSVSPKVCASHEPTCSWHFKQYIYIYKELDLRVFCIYRDKTQKELYITYVKLDLFSVFTLQGRTPEHKFSQCTNDVRVAECQDKEPDQPQHQTQTDEAQVITVL